MGLPYLRRWVMFHYMDLSKILKSPFIHSETRQSRRNLCRPRIDLIRLVYTSSGRSRARSRDHSQCRDEYGHSLEWREICERIFGDWYYFRFPMVNTLYLIHVFFQCMKPFCD